MNSKPSAIKACSAATATALLLSACAGGVSGSGVSVGVGLGGKIGRHVGLGTSINIPVGTIGRTGSSTKNNSGINVVEEQIVTYFDTEGKDVSRPVKGGYYRQLLKKQGNAYLVQDFYSSGEKRTDAMLLNRDSLYTFRANPENGVLTVYAINGSIMQQQNFRNGHLIENL